MTTHSDSAPDHDWRTVNAHGRVITLVVGDAVDEHGLFNVQVHVDGRTQVGIDLKAKQKAHDDRG